MARRVLDLSLLLIPLSLCSEDYFEDESGRQYYIVEAHEAPAQDAPSEEVLFTTPAGPRGGGVGLIGEFLYWKRSPGFESLATGIGVTHSGDTEENSAVHKTGQTSFASSHFQPGFRAGIALDFAHDGWDMKLLYTWWRYHLSSHVHGMNVGGHSLLPEALFLDVDPVISVEKVHSSLHSTLNIGDLNLGRNFYISPHLTLRPSLGVVGTYIPASLRYEAHYLAFTGAADVARISRLRSRTHTLAFGTKAGCEASFYFSGHWSIQGEYTLAALWARDKTHSSNLLTTGTAETQNMLSELVVSKLFLWNHLFLGFMWDTLFSKHRSQIKLYAGWEFNRGFENAFQSADGFLLTDGPFSMQGLSTGLRLDF